MAVPTRMVATLARHPRRTLAIVWARITGRRLRARQQWVALVGIDHRLALPPGILDRFPADAEAADDPGLCILTAPGHRLVAGARKTFAAAFAADPSLHALYGDALVQPVAGGPVFPLLRPAFDPDYLMAFDWLGPVLAVRRTSLSDVLGADTEVPALEAAFRIAEHYGASAIGHLPGIASVAIGIAGRDALPPPSAGEDTLRSRGGEESALSGKVAPLSRPLLTQGPPSPHPSRACPTWAGKVQTLGKPKVCWGGGKHASSADIETDADGVSQRGEERRPSDPHRAAVRRHLDRTGQSGTRLALGPDGVVTVVHPLPDPLPKVSVIVPTRDRVDLLRPCIASLRMQTDWPDLEILVADNESRAPETRAYFRDLEGEGVRIVPCPGPFDFAGMNNAAAAQARGALLAFVNNDVEAFAPDWLGRMVREALRPEVGAVGAKLLDGAGRIQHGGIVLGTGGLATHAHRHFPGDAPGYGLRLAATHRVSAVTAACLVVETRKFFRVGGFDPENFAVDFNDVDLCLRLQAAGYRTLMVPGAVLHHREGASRTRSAEAQARHLREIAALETRWGPLLSQDPHYHPGFDPGLFTHARLRAGWLEGPTGPAAVRRSAPSRSPT